MPDTQRSLPQFLAIDRENDDVEFLNFAAIDSILIPADPKVDCTIFMRGGRKVQLVDHNDELTNLMNEIAHYLPDRLRKKH